MKAIEQDRKYHVARARAELDMSYRATRPEAAAIHLRLSSMHLQQARASNETLPEPLARDLAWLQEFADFHGHCLNAISLDRPFRPANAPGTGEPASDEAAPTLLPARKNAVSSTHDAYGQGRRDRGKGASRGGCPHPAGTAEAGAWLNGWDDEEEAGARRPLLRLRV
jgi:hypothetical protein